MSTGQYLSTFFKRWLRNVNLNYFCIFILVEYKNKWVGEQEAIQVHMGKQQTQRGGKKFSECYL